MAGIRRVTGVAVFLAALMFSGSLFSAVNATTGPLNFTAVNQWGQWVVDVDFGATAHTETLTLTCTNSAVGFVIEMVDCTGAATANTGAAWSATEPVWNLPAQAAGTWNLLLTGSVPYVTQSLTGQHRFFFNITNPTTATNTITFTFAMAGAATLVGSGLTTPTFNPGSGTPVAIAGTASTAFVEHDIQQVFIISSLGAAADQVRFDFDVTYPATATAISFSVRGLLDISSTNQVVFDLYSLADANGGTPSVSFPITANTSTYANDCRTFTTGAYTGTHRFSLVVRAGTPFTGSHILNAWVTWSHVVTLAGAPAGAPANAKGPAISYTTPTPAAGALTGGTTGVTYTAQTFQAAGGQGAPATWLYSISSGALPAGLTLTPATATASAQITGTPTAAGNFSFTVRASNSTAGYGDEHVERAYTLNVVVGSGPLLTVSTNAVTVPTTTAGTAGTAGSFTVSGSNLTPASGSVTLTLTTGSADIEFRNATAAGTFGTGVVTINYTGGAFAAQTIEVRFRSVATAGAKTGSITIAGGGATSQVVNLSGTVNAAGTPTLIVSTNTVTVPATTAGTAGTATSFTVSGTNLTPLAGNVTLTLTTGSADIEFRNATAAGTFGIGVVTIAYTGGAFAAQTIEVRFRAVATAGAKTGSITIAGGGATNQVVNLSGTVNSAAALTIVTTTLPNGTVGTAYNGTITAQNGTGPYTWSIASGTLPAGLTLNTAATGLTTSITGTPTAAGAASFTIQVSDSAAGSDTQLYNITINPAGTGGTGLSGGGGGGGCSADVTVSPWFLLAAVAGILLVAARRRRLA